MKQRVTIAIRGRSSEWCVDSHLPQAAIDAMAADGIDIGILHNTVPGWAVDLGLLKPWCFVQDVWNFRNPFAK